MNLYQIYIDPDGEMQELFTNKVEAQQRWNALLADGSEPASFTTIEDVPAFVLDLVKQLNFAQYVASTLTTWFVHYEQRNEAGDMLFPPFRQDEQEFLVDWVAQYVAEKKGEW